jgi:hypothetical protein
MTKLSRLYRWWKGFRHKKEEDVDKWLEGYRLGARFAEAYSDSPQYCSRSAMLIMKKRGDDMARGFFDAIMDGLT